MIIILEKLEEVLMELDIEVAYQEYKGISNEYIIFDIYSETDNDYCDDGNLSTVYGITLNYWHSAIEKFKNYKTIKELMKNHGFFFDSTKTLKKEKNLYGKNFTFKYEEV